MSLVTVSLQDSVATIAMDDGKVNVLSTAMLGELDAALDRAQADRAVVVLTGRSGVFSAGFDLATLQGGGPDALAMLRGGFDLAHRLLSFPEPVVAACPGHAIAMGLFLLLSCDHRIGASGTYRYTANEVAIGLTIPYAAVEICRLRINPGALRRALVLAETFDPDGAVVAGILDEVVAGDRVADTAAAVAARCATLDLTAYAATKERLLGETLGAVRKGIDVEF